MQKLTDKASAYFVPAVIAISLLTFVVWGFFGPRLELALLNAIAVLIVACPCALGLATPVSIMVGTGRGAKEGVLVRDAEALEAMEKVEVLLIDKTGTLTEGKPRVTEIDPAPDTSEEDLLRLAGAVESQSEHPVAEAIMTAVRERQLTLPSISDFTSITGKGVTASVEGESVLIGTARLMAEKGVATEAADKHAWELRDKARTVFYVAAGGVLYPSFGILLSPVIGSAAMSLSSVSVIGNALRLRRPAT